jgi:hypothetical protein
MDEETLGVLYYEKPHPPYEPIALCSCNAACFWAILSRFPTLITGQLIVASRVKTK